MFRRRFLLAGLGMTMLAGCGSGYSSPLTDFFGGGATPGSVFTEPQRATFRGVVMRRTADNRVLIISEAAAASIEGRRLEGVILELRPLLLRVSTDSAGRFGFTEIPAGDYTLAVTLPAAEGGATASFEMKLEAGQQVEGLPAADTVIP